MLRELSFKIFTDPQIAVTDSESNPLIHSNVQSSNV